MRKKHFCTAIVLSAGSGSRMKSSVAKQYMLLEGKPIIWYALNTLQQSQIIDDCILVTGEGDIGYVRENIVEKYGFTKVSAVIAGGAERYLSVLNGLRQCANRETIALTGPGNELKQEDMSKEHYIFIHDGARPFLTEQILADTYVGAEKYRACVAAVPSKDTIKIGDGEGFVTDTPDRKRVWSIQTPQVFEVKLITEAYEALAENLSSLQEQGVSVTDDASVVELFTDCRVKLVEADYRNIKITTPEDINTAEAFLRK